MRTNVVMLALTAAALTTAACAADPADPAVDACALGDPYMAASPVHDHTGEPDTFNDTAGHATPDGRADTGCHWESGTPPTASTLTVNTAFFTPDATTTAARDYRVQARGWKRTVPVPLPTPDAANSQACRYTTNLNTGIIVHHDKTVARIAYQGPHTPQHDTTRQPAIASQLLATALSALSRSGPGNAW